VPVIQPPPSSNLPPSSPSSRPSPLVSHQVPYQYLAVPFLGNVQRGFFGIQGPDVVSQQLQDMINQYASQGWEYYHIATVYVSISTGCLASLLGIKSGSAEINQVVFRRPT
jgi:hypothetical protein